MRRVFRILRRVVGAAVFLLLLVVCGTAGLLLLTLPPAHQTLGIPGLSAPAGATFDRDGIARIRAANMTDAAAALGYVHARDRMFEMELMRRAAAGRLSEIAGGATLRLDEMARIMGLRRRAEADLRGLPPNTQAMLQAYSNGVNAWIRRTGRFAAPEFIPLGAPEAWTPVDCLLWGETMALWLSSNYRTELARTALAGRLPPAKLDQLWPSDRPLPSPDAAAADPRYAAAAGRLAAVLPGFPDPFTLPGTASDEWAVDGRHTRSGAPLLAGDPHLGFGFPAVWYLARIDTPDGVLAGATAPGVPFLVIGRNSRIAWTFTTTGADTEDLFEETVLPDGRYATPDGPRAFDTHQERIGVRGRPDVVLTVRETRHGPVISDLDHPGDPPGGPVLALSSAALKPDSTAAAGLLALDRAASVAEAVTAAPLISAPVQNLLVADRQGIALATTGRVPVRAAGDGTAPVPGADGAHDWTGWAEGGQLPQLTAPPSGRLVNGNEPTWPSSVPVLVAHDGYGDWRARRIRELLDGRDELGPADFARMQVDTVSLYARDLLPVLRAVPAPDGLPARAAALLAGWNGDMADDLPQPLLFNAWVAHIHALLLARNDAGNGLGAWEEFTRWVLLTPEGAASWCGGNCTPLLQQALADAVAELSGRYGTDPAAWRWGAAHRAVFAHPVLGAIPLLGPLTTARIEVPGDDTTLDRGGNRPGAFAALHGAEYRGIYDLSDLDGSQFMAAPGQSGNPLSRTARRFLRRWRDGDTVAIGPQPREVAASIGFTPAETR